MLSAIQLFRKRTKSSDSPQLNRLPFAAFEGTSENFNDFVERRQNGRDPVLLSLISRFPPSNAKDVVAVNRRSPRFVP
jgi:hypothetical protein